jgi:hypothetical protein
MPHLADSGELRRRLGSSPALAVGARGRQPHLSALLHGPLHSGLKHTTRNCSTRYVPLHQSPQLSSNVFFNSDPPSSSSRLCSSRRQQQQDDVRARRRRGHRAVVRHLQGRLGHRRPAGLPGRHAAVRHRSGGGPGDGVPGPPRQARAGGGDGGADPHAGLLRRGRGQRQRGGRGHQGAQRVRVRARAGGRPPGRRARGRQAPGAGQEAPAPRIQRQRRRADHRRSHGHGQRLDLARRAGHPRRHLWDLHRHVSWNRLRHVGATKNVRPASSDDRGLHTHKV